MYVRPCRLMCSISKCFLLVSITLTADEPRSALGYQSHLLQRCQSIATLPSCLWSLRSFLSLPGSCLRYFIAMQVPPSYTSSTYYVWLDFTYYAPPRFNAFRCGTRMNELIMSRIESILLSIVKLRGSYPAASSRRYFLSR